jgi:3-deoxy-manno-octulosonate cytidylyltransferase (CMP-KDO synthetase)
VATDDERIVAAVRRFGGDVAMTKSTHATGTDRLAEAAAALPDAEIVVNVQGDEPMVDPDAIDAVARAFDRDPGVEMSTAAVPLRAVSEFLSPTVVKVVTDARGDALYFSRSPIPFVRRGTAADLEGSAAEAVRRGLPLRHLGLYGYRREILERITRCPPAPLEEAEGLEQLRALYNGVRIRVETVDVSGGVAVDTPEDLARVRALLADRR